MAATSRPVTCCQSCGGALESVLFLGYMPPVNTMPAIGQAREEHAAYPLEMLRCRDCELVQIGLEVDAQVLFPPSYPYRSGSTRILRADFADLAQESGALLGLKPDDLVVDIGSNDGTLLSNFLARGQQVLGIEPSGAADDANARGIRTTRAFFGPDSARQAHAAHGAARLVTAANVFAHIGDVHQVIEGIKLLLGADGVFVSENHYLLDLVETLQYDTIYHEHLRYYHVGALQPLLARHGLEIFHVKRIPTHGGSIRVYAGHAGQRPLQPSVAAVLALENRNGIRDGTALSSFRRRVVQSKIDLHVLFGEVKRRGQRIYGIGAPSRASTLINYVGIDDGLLECVMEIAASPKLGKYVPGTRIPVLDEAKLFADQPDYALLLSWHVGAELIDTLRRKGFRGRFIVPLPEPRIID
jgi:hypothetical protein